MELIKDSKVVIITILEYGSYCDLNEYCDYDITDYHIYEQA